jgi:hypothetical protein
LSYHPVEFFRSDRGIQLFRRAVTSLELAAEWSRYLRFRLATPKPSEPKPSKPSNGSGEAVCGRFPPLRLFLAEAPVASALWSLVLEVLGLAAFWSGVVVVVVVWVPLDDGACEELAAFEFGFDVLELLVCATAMPIAKMTITNRSRIFLMVSPRVWGLSDTGG